MLNDKKAFTLIELLIVVAIIAILSAIAVPNFLEAQLRSKVSVAKNDMRMLCSATECYRVDNNRIPPSYSRYSFPEKFRWQLNRLTTPLPYIVSIPEDIFPDKVFARDGGFYPYSYYNMKCVGHSVPGSSLEYFFASAGPSLKWDMICEYDPTNGTVSTGDIRRSNLSTDGI
jgi:general secretion pathway protein G